MNFDEFCKQLKYCEGEKYSNWRISVNYINFVIQGNSIEPDEKYLNVARMFFENQDKYCKIAIDRLKNTLKFEYKYYLHTVCFQEYCYGLNNLKTKEGGFEMMFWQAEPDDDRYVNYVVQFSESGWDCGFRIFCW